MTVRNADEPLRSLDECVQWALSGAKPHDQFRIGTEYERLCIGPDGALLPYDGPVSIRALLEQLCERFGWQPKFEAGRPIAALRDQASITLEPAGQLELSGAPVANVAEMVRERDLHLAELDEIATPLGIRFVYTGINPLDTPATASHMPKARYSLMRKWMPRVGGLGLDMMHLTCTVQTNLDFDSPHSAMEQLRLGYLATPAIIALFANSPWHLGGPVQMASQRAHIWTDVDNARCTPGRWVYEPDSTVGDYVRWAADVPMYFLERPVPGDAAELQTLPWGFTFADFLRDAFEGRRATITDWENHIGTLFPDVRLKRHIEIRGADCVPPRLLAALPALTEGLFYDVTARADALELMRDGDATVDRAALRQQACIKGLDGKASGIDLRAQALQLLQIAREGLARLVQQGREEASAADHLNELEAIARREAEPLYAVTAAKLAENRSLLSIAEPVA